MHKKLSHGCCYCAITIGNCNNSRKPLNPPTLTISSFTTFVSDHRANFDKDWLQTLISSDILNQPSPSDKSTFDNWRSAGDLTWSNKVLSATLISLFSNYTRSFNCVECFSLWMGVLNRRYSVRFWRGIVGDFFLVVGNKTWTLWHSVGGGREGVKLPRRWERPLSWKSGGSPWKLHFFISLKSKELSEARREGEREREFEAWILKEWKYIWKRTRVSTMDPRLSSDQKRNLIIISSNWNPCL